MSSCTTIDANYLPDNRTFVEKILFSDSNKEQIINAIISILLFNPDAFSVRDANDSPFFDDRIFNKKLKNTDVYKPNSEIFTGFVKNIGYSSYVKFLKDILNLQEKNVIYSIYVTLKNKFSKVKKKELNIIRYILIVDPKKIDRSTKHVIFDKKYINKYDYEKLVKKEVLDVNDNVIYKKEKSIFEVVPSLYSGPNYLNPIVKQEMKVQEMGKFTPVILEKDGKVKEKSSLEKMKMFVDFLNSEDREGQIMDKLKNTSIFKNIGSAVNKGNRMMENFQEKEEVVKSETIPEKKEEKKEENKKILSKSEMVSNLNDIKRYVSSKLVPNQRDIEIIKEINKMINEITR